MKTTTNKGVEVTPSEPSWLDDEMRRFGKALGDVSIDITSLFASPDISIPVDKKPKKKKPDSNNINLNQASNKKTDDKKSKLKKIEIKLIDFLYSIADASGLSASLPKIMFEFIYANNRSSSGDYLHDWMISPLGISVVAVESIGLITFSMLASIFKDDDPDAIKRNIAFFWPFIRDVLKALKNAYKALRTLFQIVDILNASNVSQFLLPIGLTIGLVAAVNRVLLRYFDTERQNIQKLRFNLYEEIKMQEFKLDAYYLWRVRLKESKETETNKRLSLLSGLYSGLVDGLYLYMGSLSLCVLSASVFPIMAGFCFTFSALCLITRIYEQYAAQQKLIADETKIKLALEGKKIEYYYNYIFSYLEDPPSLDVHLNNLTESEINLIMEERQRPIQESITDEEIAFIQAERQKPINEEGLTEAAVKVIKEERARPIQESLTYAEIKLIQQQRARSVSRHLTKADIDLIKKEREKPLAFLLDEYNRTLDSFGKYQKKLVPLLTVSYIPALLTGLRDGLAAYSALNSFLFAISGICVLLSASFPPVLVIISIALGAALVLGFAIYSLIQAYREENTEGKNAEADIATEELGDIVSICKEKNGTERLIERLSVKEPIENQIERAMNLYSTPQNKHQTWAELFRSLGASAGKGTNGVRHTGNFMMERGADGHYHETPFMFLIEGISVIIHSIIFGLRAIVRFGRDEKYDLNKLDELATEKRAAGDDSLAVALISKPGSSSSVAKTSQTFFGTPLSQSTDLPIGGATPRQAESGKTFVRANSSPNLSKYSIC